jgi:hypothetical protein
MQTANKRPYLTKSRFKLALECPTKLFYAGEGQSYFDKNDGNDFLSALADGGNQVGELAKYKYHDDPVGQAITVEPLGYAPALNQTAEKLAVKGRVVVAEAALLHADFFVRVDILIRDPDQKTIDIIEVKSKSVSDETIASRFKNTRGQFDGGWLPYLYDVTFQVEVARRVFPNYKVRAKLLLLDANQPCAIDGLNQFFQIVLDKDAPKDRPRAQVVSPAGLKKSDLGSLDFLREVAVDDIVDELRHKPIDNAAHIPDPHRENLTVFMEWAGEMQMTGTRIFHGVSKACKSCQFRAPPGSPQRSGLHECWRDAIEQGLLDGGRNLDSRVEPLSIDLWGGVSGGSSLADTVIKHRRAFLADIQESDVQPKSVYKGQGMSPLERRMLQVEAANKQADKHVLDEERLKEMDQWEWPLHMIDFETSAPSLPFFNGMQPYQTIAFQFSHHVMSRSEDGLLQIKHANQWISTEAGFFPNIEFVRQLRLALMPEGRLFGTVFRYHNHENTVLRSLRATIADSPPQEVPDAAELISFIDLITKATGEEVQRIGPFEGEKAMVDLHRLIQESYCSSLAKGSISLKFILPAILKDAQEVADFYRQPGVYGKGLQIESLNFQNEGGHQWLQAHTGDDPYKTLPAIFGPEHGQLNELLFRLARDAEDETAINQGGLAMTAYNYTQYSGLRQAERQSISDALLRYCELDTLAMVMVVQGLMALREKSRIASTSVYTN